MGKDQAWNRIDHLYLHVDIKYANSDQDDRNHQGADQQNKDELPGFMPGNEQPLGRGNTNRRCHQHGQNSGLE